jgi:hypothetical protein
MKEAVEAIADAIDDEDFSDDWTIKKHDPVWRNPQAGKVLAVYGTRRFVSEYRTNSYRYDTFEIVLEYMESAGRQAVTLQRDEAAELAIHDVADELVQWVDDHQSLASAGIDALDFVQTTYAPRVNREAMVRYIQITIHARKKSVYR